MLKRAKALVGSMAFVMALSLST
ncbi:MAG: hypothetical protein JWO72_3296, partial [Caulobacteraceae bacterium]|nr:hypothetical protein [Caulobacteraceae bacterium]